MKRRQRGATAVEFALTLPVLLAMLFGIAQLAWWMMSYVVLQSAAATGARQLSMERGFGTPYTDTVNAIEQQTGVLANATTIVLSVGGTVCANDVTCTSALGSSTDAPVAGTQAAVSLNYTFKPLFTGSLDGLGTLLPTTQTVTTASLVQ